MAIAGSSKAGEYSSNLPNNWNGHSWGPQAEGPRAGSPAPGVGEGWGEEGIDFSASLLPQQGVGGESGGQGDMCVGYEGRAEGGSWEWAADLTALVEPIV